MKSYGQKMMNDTKEEKTTTATKLVAIVLGLPWVEILPEIWKIARTFLRGHANEGVYEVLDWNNTLELHDKVGKKATFKKREKVRFLQDNTIAYQDEAWSDGKFLIGYHCSPGLEADRYRLGYKTYILISLRSIKERGDIEEFDIGWGIRNGFLRESEQWETYIGHKVNNLRVSIIFPKTRPPLLISIVENRRQRRTSLVGSGKRRLKDGRWKVTWEKKNPMLYERYILNWDW